MNHFDHDGIELIDEVQKLRLWLDTDISKNSFDKRIDFIKSNHQIGEVITYEKPSKNYFIFNCNTYDYIL